jgi:hypothetical protein
LSARQLSYPTTLLKPRQVFSAFFSRFFKFFFKNT